MADARVGLLQADIENHDFDATSSDHTIQSAKESAETQTKCKSLYSVDESLATDWISRTMRRIDNALSSKRVYDRVRRDEHVPRWEGKETNNKNTGRCRLGKLRDRQTDEHIPRQHKVPRPNTIMSSTTLYRKSRPSGSVEIRSPVCGKVDRFRGAVLIRIHARPTTFLLFSS